MQTNTPKQREVRAQFNSKTITVYQAYNSLIVEAAVKNQTFTPPTFKIERMTWIKPSFLWMMYRSGWAKKENQERVLEIKIKREGFEWALEHASLSHFIKSIHKDQTSWKTNLKNAPVRIQWDPEKDMFLNALDYRSIQIGLHQEAVEKYVNEWIVEVNDITETCHHIHQLILEDRIQEAKELLPKEEIYPVPNTLRKGIYMEEKVK